MTKIKAKITRTTTSEEFPSKYKTDEDFNRAHAKLTEEEGIITIMDILYGNDGKKSINLHSFRVPE